MDSCTTWASVSQCSSFPLSPPSSPALLSQILLKCLSLLLCAVGSFSEHLDQINGRSECVDSADNASKPSSEPASHVARQRLESTEKKRISGKVTKSLSASALSLMIPGGRETSTRMQLCDLCMCPPSPSVACWLRCKAAWPNNGWCPGTALLSDPLEGLQGSRKTNVTYSFTLLSAAGDEAGSLPTKAYFFCFLSFSFLPSPS